MQNNAVVSISVGVGQKKIKLFFLCFFFQRTMTGIEYEVLHVQDPILYVIRKQHRISPTQGRIKKVLSMKVKA